MRFQACWVGEFGTFGSPPKLHRLGAHVCHTGPCLALGLASTRLSGLFDGDVDGGGGGVAVTSPVPAVEHKRGGYLDVTGLCGVMKDEAPLYAARHPS